MIEIHNADLFDKVKTLEDESIDLVLTDFPYNLAFMNLEFDKVKDDFFYRVGKELFPKMKPGSFLVTTFTPRQDQLWRVLMSLEQAGFSLKSSPIFWLYHSGFPKAMDLSKAIDRKNGFVRGRVRSSGNLHLNDISHNWSQNPSPGDMASNEPVSEQAKEWKGWKSYQTKPSVEVIITVQKPLREKTIVEQVLNNGHGAINVEETRIPYSNESDSSSSAFFNSMSNKKNDFSESAFPIGTEFERDISTNGRFPANIIVEGNPLKGKETQTNPHEGDEKKLDKKGEWGFTRLAFKNSDSGTTNRFYSLDSWAEKHNITLTEDSAFLDVPKPAPSEKDENLEGELNYSPNSLSGGTNKRLDGKSVSQRINNHPTVKPYILFCYLLKMFGKRDWTILDPFMGSGTTGIACSKMGMNFIGIEKSKDYFSIAEKRLADYQKQKKLEAWS